MSGEDGLDRSRQTGLQLFLREGCLSSGPNYKNDYCYQLSLWCRRFYGQSAEEGLNVTIQNRNEIERVSRLIDGHHDFVKRLLSPHGSFPRLLKGV